MIKSDFHTHTTYCDGKNSPKEMVEAAYKNGFSAIGFSSHSHTPFDESYCMSVENTEKYIHEVNALKEIFARGAQYWKTVLQWGTSRKLLSEKEVAILTLAANMFVTGRVISDKQAQVVISARKRLIENGMPMQF